VSRNVVSSRIGVIFGGRRGELAGETSCWGKNIALVQKQSESFRSSGNVPVDFGMAIRCDIEVRLERVRELRVLRTVRVYDCPSIMWAEQVFSRSVISDVG
jgi:hypothetical protein